jgi:hypothetical protein
VEARQSIGNAREHLAIARAGLDEIESGNPARRRPGMMNVAVFGRSATQALQHMRSDEPSFDDWWQPKIAKVGADPLFVFFNTLRNTILKEGELPSTNRSELHSMGPAEQAAIMANPPPGAKGFVIGDSLGGNGWMVEMPDGSLQMFYVEVPEAIASSRLELVDAPTEHCGTPIPDASFATLGRLYIDALTRLVNEAEERFG